ncbi:MAG: acyl-CoA dehydrogenase [Spirochaetes bacterium]|nr:acyl-CoA dehydrogenase [Spirochaetota bacterium]
MDNSALYKSECINAEELSQFRDLAKKFSLGQIRPLLEESLPDGRLNRVHDIINSSHTLGIITSVDELSPGHEFGIWGRAADRSIAPSAALLGAIAETCGGIAFCCHVQGVPSHLIIHAAKHPSFTSLRPALCLQEGPYPPSYSTLFHPDREPVSGIVTAAKKNTGAYSLNGSKSFVYSATEPDGYVVFARVDERLRCFLVPIGTPGITRIDVGQRTGLRAATLGHLDFDEVPVSEDNCLDDGDALDLACTALGLHWAGMSAIAAGIARGAVKAAQTYAAERYQGGGTIENHPAVKKLIGASEARAAAADGVLGSLTAPPGTRDFLKQAAMAKLSATELGAEAVTDSLQVFGGYGYMEDFGMEKRLRDIAVLKAAGGPPNYLKQFIADMSRES